MKKGYIRTVFALCALFLVSLLQGQERVYVSTDKECYLAGEDLWLSVFCMDEERGGYSQLSKVAYLEFHSVEGCATTVKLPLKEGRGCGRLQIPLNFATGNYSIVAYTAKYGGKSTCEFNGKVVSIFNTLLSQRVAEGVEVVGTDESLKGEGKVLGGCNWLSVEVDPSLQGDQIPVTIKNLSEKGASFSISVYHLDPLEEMIGASGYNRFSLLERKGDFQECEEPDYAGEVIRARISQGNSTAPLAQKGVYMSAMGNTDDIYINTANEKGEVVFYTSNIYGTRDLVFEVEGDTSQVYNVEILHPQYSHKSAAVPVLKISTRMREALESRSMNMQIAKRFEADTLFNIEPMRPTSFFGQVKPAVYRLDDYTRFPVMSEVIGEYVKDLRIRKEGNETVMRLLWATRARALVLLDGVPVTDHSIVVNMDPHLVKEIVLYPRRYVLNNKIYDGIVKFNTYKKDMGGVNLARNVSIVNHKGVQYPLAFLGDQASKVDNYPNFNNTIYWNPIQQISAGETVGFNCFKPQYKGAFRMVLEGITSDGEQFNWSTVFNIE